MLSRGDRREDIYQDDVDRQDFLKTLAEACQKTDWQVHAYCLMSNHFHLSYPWSSLGWYLAAPKHRPGWLRVDRLLGEHEIGSRRVSPRKVVCLCHDPSKSRPLTKVLGLTLSIIISAVRIAA